jgi:hypothetical protein
VYYEYGVFHVFTNNEKELICSEEKRKTLSTQNLRNRFQKIRDKAAQAIEDLLLLGDNQSIQLAQALGFTRSGRRMPKIKRKNGNSIELIESPIELKRIERSQRAQRLAFKLALNMGVIDRWRSQKELEEKSVERQKITKIIDLQKLGRLYPRILIGMLQNQYVCPKCGKAGLIFRGEDEWIWMHYNQEDSKPEATFCNVGKNLPRKFIEFPFIIRPQNNGFWVQLAELEYGEGYRFYS